MDVFKYLRSFIAVDADEEEISKFLNENENYIRENILNLWGKYISGAKNNYKKKQNDAGISASNVKHDMQLKNKNITVPNGKVNHEYKFIFNLDVADNSEIENYWFEDLERLGLVFNPENNEISGVPSVAGEHQIKLKVKRKDWSEGRPILERIITLIINPDPKSLWKNITTPENMEYYKPDNDKTFINICRESHKNIVAASQRGRSHAHEGKARDDAFNIKYMEDADWYVLAVADGAGSAKYSRKGSEIVCRDGVSVCEEKIKVNSSVLEEFIKNYNFEKNAENRKKIEFLLYDILGNAVFKSVKNIEQEAERTGRPVKDFSTTLILSICKKFNFGWFIGSFQAGDGGIGVYNKKEQIVKALGVADSGEFAGQTRFVTMPEITQPDELYKRLKFEIVDDFTALILMTDGVTDPEFETEANFQRVEKWNDLWDKLSREIDFNNDSQTVADRLLTWLDFWSPGNHDDRTIAILY